MGKDIRGLGHEQPRTQDRDAGLGPLCDALGVTRQFPAEMRALWRRLYGRGRGEDSAGHHRSFGVRRSLTPDEARQVARHRRRIRERASSDNYDRAAIADIHEAAKRRHQETIAIEERRLAHWQYVKGLYRSARSFMAGADAARAAVAERDIHRYFKLADLRKMRGRIRFEPPNRWVISGDWTVGGGQKRRNGTIRRNNAGQGFPFLVRPHTHRAGLVVTPQTADYWWGQAELSSLDPGLCSPMKLATAREIWGIAEEEEESFDGSKD